MKFSFRGNGTNLLVHTCALCSLYTVGNHPRFWTIVLLGQAPVHVPESRDRPNVLTYYIDRQRQKWANFTLFTLLPWQALNVRISVPIPVPKMSEFHLVHLVTLTSSKCKNFSTKICLSYSHTFQISNFRIEKVSKSSENDEQIPQKNGSYHNDLLLEIWQNDALRS